MAIHIVYNGDYVSAVTDTLAELNSWIDKKTIPVNLTIETLPSLSFPFYALEDHTKIRKFTFHKEFPPIMHVKDFCIYKFDKPWQGQPDWSDYMGALEHTHGEEK